MLKQCTCQLWRAYVIILLWFKVVRTALKGKVCYQVLLDFSLLQIQAACFHMGKRGSWFLHWLQEKRSSYAGSCCRKTCIAGANSVIVIFPQADKNVFHMGGKKLELEARNENIPGQKELQRKYIICKIPPQKENI